MKKIISLLLTLVLVLSLAACGAKEAPAVLDVNSLYESYNQYLPEMFFPDEATMLNFLGIQAEDCVQYKIALCGEGMRADEVWLIEAKDDAALENLQQKAQNRINSKLDETESYVPDQFAIVQQAQLVVSGRYLALLISPDAAAMKTAFEAALQ